MNEERHLVNLLSEKRPSIISKWFHRILEAYPADSVHFFKKEKNQFANPVGYTVSQEIEALYQDLLKTDQPLRTSPSLVNIIRIKAVQDFSSSEAVSFVFILKNVIEDELKNELQELQILNQFVEFESRIDQLALLAFEEYMKCREKIYQIKANQITNQTYKLLERADLLAENAKEEDEDSFSVCNHDRLNQNGGNGR